MAKIGLPKGSGKRLKVREKSVKSQGILKWILSGNPDIHVSYENTFDNSDRDSQQGRAWACASPPLPLNQDYASFVLFTDAILNVLVVKFDKKYIYLGNQSRISCKNTHFFAPERYTAGILYTDSLNSA